MIQILRSLIILCFLFTPVMAQPLDTSAKQAIVIDYETGAVLLEKNADAKMPTSSMSKVMTMYMVFEALKAGKLSLEDEFQVSEKAWQKGGSKMFVEVDKKVSIEDLIRGVIVQSGNDATIVLAEGLAGTEGAFADNLNKKARQLGMANSHFMNASGWPDPEHYSTARDLSILAKAMIQDFPDYYPYYAEQEFTFNNIKQRNRNPLLYRNVGADGIKTGHTEDGGYGLMGTGTHDGRRVILVINGLEDERARAEESGKLLDWGLGRFENRKLFVAGQGVEMAKVALGQEANVPLVLKDDLKVTLPKSTLGNFKVTAQFKEPLVAPVQAGTELGVLTVEVPNMRVVQAPLYAGKSVEPLGFFAKTIDKAKLFLRGG